MRGDGWFKHWLNPFQCKLLVLSAVELLLQDVIAKWVICMKNHSSRVKPVIAAIVSFMMTFSLALGPGLASALDEPNDFALTTSSENGMPEWAIDDGENAQDALSTQASIPEKYDLRDEGVVTPVKLQNPWGSCWAFGGLAAAETSILSTLGYKYEDFNIDLSESHLTYFALRPVTEEVNPRQVGEGFHLFDDSPNAAFNAGGWGIYITTLLSSGIGPVFESQFPYRGKGAMTSLEFFDSSPENAEIATRGELEQKAFWSGTTVDAMLAAKATELGSAEAALEHYKDEARAKYVKRNTYNQFDDWSIPETRENGMSNRMISYGLVLKNGNILPDYWDASKTKMNDSAVTAIKQELLNGRGVSLAYGADQSGTYDKSDPRYGTGYCQYTGNASVSPDHIVCIVGWDDTYEASNFTHTKNAKNQQLTDSRGNPLTDEQAEEMTTPAGNGAWIVKNSWGSETDAAPDDLGNVVNKDSYGYLNEEGKATGYFYLSYYDKTISLTESMEFSSNLGKLSDFGVIQYDYMPAVNGFFSTPASETLVSSANAFEMGGMDVVVKSMSTRTSEENMRVTLAIVLLDDNATSPGDGRVVFKESRNFEYKGFHRIDLDVPLTIKKGQRFSIISTTSKVNTDGTRSYCVSANKGTSKESAEAQRAQGAYVAAYTEAVVNEGESWVYLDGAWQDWKTYLASDEAKAISQGDPVDNFSIKLYVELTDSQLAEMGAVPATCTQPGCIQYWCDTETGTCYGDAEGTVAIDWQDTVTAALGHDWGKGEVTKKATACAEGARTYTCSRCGQTRTEPIPMTVIRGKTYKVSGSTYKVTSNTLSKRTVALVKAKTVAAGETFTIPATVKIKGASYKVTAIEALAFDGSRAVGITVGPNVTNIDRNDFNGARRVKIVTLGKGVGKVSARAFTTNDALHTLVLKTKKLAKADNVKNCLKGSNVTAVKVKVGTAEQNEAYAKKYKKLFAVSNPASGKKVAVA